MYTQILQSQSCKQEQKDGTFGISPLTKGLLCFCFKSIESFWESSVSVQCSNHVRTSFQHAHNEPNTCCNRVTGIVFTFVCVRVHVNMCVRTHPLQEKLTLQKGFRTLTGVWASAFTLLYRSLAELKLQVAAKSQMMSPIAGNKKPAN